MAEYSERERAFNNSVPGLFGQYTEAIVLADVKGKIAFLEFVKGVFTMENVTIQQKIDIIDRKAIKFGMSLPPSSLIDMTSVGIDTATLKMSMQVSASDESNFGSDTEASLSGEGRVGWGPFRVRVSMSAKQSIHSDRKRKSDYTATTDAELKMCRQPVPETLAKYMDMAAGIADKAMDINVALVSKQIEDAKEGILEDPDLGTSDDVEPSAADEKINEGDSA